MNTSRSRAALAIVMLVTHLVCINGQECPENPDANKTRIGNGWCNGNPAIVWKPNETGPVLNTESCVYDGGDCCQSTCDPQCELGSPGCYRCNVNGFDCVDPREPAYLTREPSISRRVLRKEDAERLDVSMRRVLENNEDEVGTYHYHDFYNIPNESTCLSKFNPCHDDLKYFNEEYKQGCLFEAEADEGTRNAGAEGHCIRCPDELSSANAAKCVGAFPEGITMASIPDIFGEDRKKLDILVSKVDNSSQFGLASAAISLSFDADDVRNVFIHAFLNTTAGYAFFVNDEEYSYFYDLEYFPDEVLPAWFGVIAQKSTPIKNVKIYGRYPLEEEHGARVLINGLLIRTGPLYEDWTLPDHDATGDVDDSTGAAAKSVGALLINTIAATLLAAIART